MDEEEKNTNAEPTEAEIDEAFGVEPNEEPEKPKEAAEIITSKPIKSKAPLVAIILGIVIFGLGVLSPITIQHLRGQNANSSSNSEPSPVILTPSLSTGIETTLEEEEEEATEVEETVISAETGETVTTIRPKTRPAVNINANDDLVIKLLKLHNYNENSCISPLSIRYALAMMRDGANGETREQIDAVLGSATIPRYENVEGHLAVANSLWTRTDYADAIKPEFAETLRANYGAEYKVDSFTSAANLNSWIETNSLGLLKDVIDDDFAVDLHAALVNVLAIDMEWALKFEPIGTRQSEFYSSRGFDNPSTVAMMMETVNATENISYFFANDATVLALDLKEYNGTQLQFVSIMPTEKELQEYISGLSMEDLVRLTSGLTYAKAKNNSYYFTMSYYLPRFEISSGIDDLIGDLKELGVSNAFDEEAADFSNMVNGKFFIDRAVHKTKFDLSEEGIKAAAVTAFGGKGAAGPLVNRMIITIAINHPFLYLVRDKATGDIWFVGTVYDPTLWSSVSSQYNG